MNSLLDRSYQYYPNNHNFQYNTFSTFGYSHFGFDYSAAAAAAHNQVLTSRGISFNVDGLISPAAGGKLSPSSSGPQLSASPVQNLEGKNCEGEP